MVRGRTRTTTRGNVTRTTTGFRFSRAGRGGRGGTGRIIASSIRPKPIPIRKPSLRKVKSSTRRVKGSTRRVIRKRPRSQQRRSIPKIKTTRATVVKNRGFRVRSLSKDRPARRVSQNIPRRLRGQKGREVNIVRPVVRDVKDFATGRSTVRAIQRTAEVGQQIRRSPLNPFSSLISEIERTSIKNAARKEQIRRDRESGLREDTFSIDEIFGGFL